LISRLGYPASSASWHFTCQLFHGFLLVTSQKA
jgi:hypothetical protein